MDQIGLGADFLQLDPVGVPSRGITDWLVGALRGAIGDGRLTAGARLPATRTLAADLGALPGGELGGHGEGEMAAIAEIGKAAGHPVGLEFGVAVKGGDHPLGLGAKHEARLARAMISALTA